MAAESSIPESNLSSHDVTQGISALSGDKIGSAPGQSSSIVSLLSSMATSLKSALTEPTLHSEPEASSAPLFKAGESKDLTPETTQGKEAQKPAQPLSDLEQLVHVLSNPNANESTIETLRNTISTAFEGAEGTTVFSQNLDKVMPLMQDLQGLMTEVFSTFPSGKEDLNEDGSDTQVDEKLTAKLQEFVGKMRTELTPAPETSPAPSANDNTASVEKSVLSLGATQTPAPSTSSLENAFVAIESIIGEFQQNTVETMSWTVQLKNETSQDFSNAAKGAADAARNSFQKYEKKEKKEKRLHFWGKVFGVLLGALTAVVCPALATGIITMTVLSASGATPLILKGLTNAFGGGKGGKIAADILFVTAMVLVASGGAQVVESLTEEGAAAAEKAPGSSNKVMKWLSDHNALKGRPVLSAALLTGSSATMQSGLLMNLAELVPAGAGRTTAEVTLAVAGVLGTLLAGLFGGMATFKPGNLLKPNVMLGLHYTRLAGALGEGIMNGATAVNQFETAFVQKTYQQDTAIQHYLQDLDNGTVSDMGSTTQFFTKLAGEYHSALVGAMNGFIQTGAALSEIGA